MTFEFTYEHENKEMTLKEAQAKSVVKTICSNFKKWDNLRSSNLLKSQKLIDEIFFKSGKKSHLPEDSWKSDVKMGKAYMLFQTQKSVIWRNIYSNVNAMFDVAGENQDADNNSNKQKAMLVNVFNKMELSKRLDKIIDNSLFYGELIAFVSWKKSSKEIRRPINFFETLFSGDFVNLAKILEAKTAGKNFYTDVITTYDNPYVYEVNPVDFVFDVSQVDNFDSCPKILRTYKTADEILSNDLYEISKEDREQIKSSTVSKYSTTTIEKSKIKGDTIEVLEAWGDLKLDDGTILKNWHAVVVGGNYLVRFKKNELIENPFVFGTYIQDPETKRGISPISSVVDLILQQEEMLNRTYNMQALSENPPTFAPEDFFKDKTTKLYPGKIITYDAGIYTNVPITPMQFPTNLYINEIMSLDKTIAEVSGIFPNMAGQEKAQGATATEISVTVQGQSNRHSMLLDIINQYLILPIVKKTADLLANFKYGKETIYINRENKADVIDIDDSVRQAEYEYTYQDRNSYALRYNNADTTAQVFEKFAQVLPMNWKEIFSWYWEQKGVENPERFLEDDNVDELQISNIIEQLSQNPEIYNQLFELLENEEEINSEENQNENNIQEQGQDKTTIEEVMQNNIENGEHV